MIVTFFTCDQIATQTTPLQEKLETLAKTGLTARSRDSSSACRPAKFVRSAEYNRCRPSCSLLLNVAGHVIPSVLLNCFEEKPQFVVSQEIAQLSNNFLFLFNLPFSEPFWNSLNYASMSHIREVIKFYDLGENSFETDISKKFPIFVSSHPISGNSFKNRECFTYG